MRARLSIVAGLVAGIATAVAILGGILAFAPEPGPAVTPAPQPSIAEATEAASPAPSNSPSAAPSASVAPSGGAGASIDTGALFGVGKPAPDLVVPQVGGGTIDLASLRGKPVWVNFMATWCPPCIDEFPLMSGFAARYGDDGLVILAIDVKEEEGAVAAFADRLNATFPLGLDGDGSSAERWGAAAALPVHFWVDKDGIVRDAALGGIGPDVMARGLQSILPGVTVNP